MKPANWTEQELIYLKEMSGKIPPASFLLNRTLSSIRTKANDLKLSLALPKMSTLSPLTNGSHTSLYWMGFLMADGHFDASRSTLAITIGEKDLTYLQQLATLLNANISTYIRKPNNIIQMSVCDKTNFGVITNKWDLHNNKTKNPPSKLPELTKEEFYSWIIGFVDGDGSIEKPGNSGTIVSGLEWKHIIEHISIQLNCPNIEIRKPTTFSNNESLRLRLRAEPLRILKEHAIKHELPILLRKWDRVRLVRP